MDLPVPSVDLFRSVKLTALTEEDVMAAATLSSIRRGPDAAAPVAIPGDRELDESTATAIIDAAIDRIDIGGWWLAAQHSLGPSDRVTAGFTGAPDGKRISVDVELVGGRLLAHYCVERLARRNHLILESVSDLVTPTGRTTMRILWEASVASIGANRSALTSRVRTNVAKEFASFLRRQGIPFDAFLSRRLPVSVSRNERQTRLFAAGIERAVRAN
jgi:hypothetical protein